MAVMIEHSGQICPDCGQALPPAPPDIRHDLIHLAGPFFDELMPVHELQLITI